MEVKITSIENIGEALLVTGVVDKKPVCATVKSKLMFDDPERGILDILRRIASQPPVEEVKGEKVEGEEPVAVRVPDAARVAKRIKEVKS